MAKHNWIPNDSMDMYVCPKCRVRISKYEMFDVMLENELFKTCLDRLAGPCVEEDECQI